MSTTNTHDATGDARPPVDTQLNTLPGTTTHLTGHNEEGKAIVYQSRPAHWKAFDDKTMAFNQIFTNTFPASLANNTDITTHDDIIASGTLGLVHPSGVVCRMVDFAPGYECMMHRTSSLDFGIVIEGAVEMILDDGSKTVMQRGDVAVQRATMHSWRNVSESEWARMVFVLQDVQGLVVGGKRMGEDLGRGTVGLPRSGNDA